MTVVYAPDVSKFQVPVDDSFNRDWFIFRLCFAGDIDDNAAHNLAWAIKARAAGKIDGFTGYVVPQPGSNDALMALLDRLGYPTDAPVMIDAEKWPGLPYEIFGDHSDEFNALAARIRTRQHGRDDLAWAYGNRGPDLEVWPRKAAWLGWLVAGYTSADEPSPALPPNAIGWQYTNGQSAWDNDGRPHSTPPFGRCDHDALYVLPERDDMPLTDIDADKFWQHPLIIDPETGKATLPAASFLRQARADADAALAQVKALARELDDVKAAVAKIQPGNVTLDSYAIGKAIAAHLTLTAK